MNHSQRLMNAIEGKPTDRVPVWPFMMTFAARYAGVPYSKFASDYRAMAQALIACAERFDVDGVTVDSDAFREATAFGAKITYPNDSLPQLVQQAIIGHKLPGKPPRLEESHRLVDKVEGVRMIKHHFGASMPVCGWIEAPLQSAATLYSINQFMMDIYDEPIFVADLLEQTTQLGIEFAIAQAHAGADIIGVGDAMASLVSADTYQAQFYSYTRQLVEGIRSKANVKLKYHVCGRSIHLLPFVETLGFDIVNIDYAVDMQKATQIVGKVCIKGNINPVDVLMNGTPQDVARAANALCNIGNPRFILSPGCEVPRDTPYAQLDALINCVR